jgi:hypothetical protein
VKGKKLFPMEGIKRIFYKCLCDHLSSPLLGNIIIERNPLFNIPSLDDFSLSRPGEKTLTLI